MLSAGTKVLVNGSKEGVDVYYHKKYAAGRTVIDRIELQVSLKVPEVTGRTDADGTQYLDLIH